MTNKTKSLVAKLDMQIKSKPAEHILNVLKAGLATAPFCGGVASLMTDYIPTAKQERMEEFTRQLAEDLERLQDKVNENIILTDEFAYVFEKCYRGVSENYQKERINAFRGILVNSAMNVEIVEDEKDYFISLVSNLSVLHIKVLNFMASPCEYLRANDISTNSISGGFSDFFPVAIPGASLDLIKSAFGDLYQYGFLNTDKKIFETMTSGQGLDLIGNGGRVTSQGHKFINFCKTP